MKSPFDIYGNGNKLPNFKKISKFDDGEAPPRVTKYPDWSDRDTEIWLRNLTDEFDYDDVIEEIGKKGFEIVEDMMEEYGGKLFCMKVGLTKFRVRKVK